MKELMYKPIGIIRSPFDQIEGMPIQPTGAGGISGTVIVNREYREGLKDLDGFSHIILLYDFNMAQGYDLTPVPFMDSKPRGVFSTRAPRRPNTIGLSIVKLVGVEDHILHIENVDILDGTPLLDIKPYVTAFDCHTSARCGWLEMAKKDVRAKRSDDRFK